MVRKSVLIIGVPVIVAAAAFSVYSMEPIGSNLMAMCRGRSRKKRTNHNSQSNQQEQNERQQQSQKSSPIIEESEDDSALESVDAIEVNSIASAAAQDNRSLMSSSRCSKCKIIEKKLKDYLVSVKSKNKACSECKTIGLFREQLKACRNKDVVGAIFQPGKSHATHRIGDNDVGFSFPRMFTKYFNDRQLTVIEIDDPYIKQQYQFANFLRLCELAVKTDNSLTFIKLKTKKDCIRDEIASYMDSLKDELKEDYGIDLKIEFCNELHDREIRMNNGFNIKLGRGLDFFKPLRPFEIGYYDMDMRPCRATTIDVIHERGTV